MGVVPDDVKRFVRAVLLSSDKGVLLRDFRKDYLKLVGKQLPYSQLGFASCEEMLKAMPDAVTVVRTDPYGELKLYGRGDGVSYMTSAAKKAQRPKGEEEIIAGYGCALNRTPDPTGYTSQRMRPTERYSLVMNRVGSPANPGMSVQSVHSVQLRLQELKRRQIELKSKLRSVEQRRLDGSSLCSGLDDRATSKQTVEQRIRSLRETVRRKAADLELATKQNSDLRSKLAELQ